MGTRRHFSFLCSLLLPLCVNILLILHLNWLFTKKKLLVVPVPTFLLYLLTNLRKNDHQKPKFSDYFQLYHQLTMCKKKNSKTFVVIHKSSDSLIFLIGLSTLKKFHLAIKSLPFFWTALKNFRQWRGFEQPCPIYCRYLPQRRFILSSLY